MKNKHIKMIIITSLCLGIFMFLFFWLVEGLYFGIVVGLITLFGSFGFLQYAFSKSESTLQSLLEKYSSDDVLYSDTAGLMQDNKEVIGALLITKDQFIFRPVNQTYNILQIKTADIKPCYNENGFLHIVHESYEYSFKVFDCPKIVEILNSLQ